MKLLASEVDVLAVVLDWLNTLPQTRVWRQNVGGREYLKANGRKGIVHFGQPGMADLSGICHGLRLEVEIKRKGQKPKPLQDEWLAFIQHYRGLGFWCDSLDSCVVAIRAEFWVHGWEWKKSFEP